MNKLLFTYLLLFSISYSNDLNALLDKFLSIFQSKKTEFNRQENYSKCNFATIYNIKKNYHNFAKYQQELIDYYLNYATQSDTFIVSPSGKFRINFNKSENLKPKYNVDSVAIIIDSVYKYEVTYLGFISPKGKYDDKYDIYIQNISDYGYTELISQNPIRSQIILANDYSNYYTSGLDAVRVTLAHEFHHAIQFHYKLPDEDIFFYELTSTSMEEFVFPDINDYIHYIKNYKTYYNFKFGDGYSQAIWNIFLFEYLKDINIFKKQWEFFKSNSALNAIDLSLKTKGKSFLEIFPKFANSLLPENRSQYYSDWHLFPKLKFFPLIKYPTNNYLTTVAYSSFRYFGVINENNDTSYAILLNSNNKTGDLAKTDDEGIGVEMILSKYQTSNAQQLSNGIYLTVNFNKYDEGNKVITNTGSSEISKLIIYPNPLNITKNKFINLNFPNSIKTCEVSIFDINFNQKFNKIFYNGKNFNIELDNSFSTGIYFINVQADNNLYKKKLAIIR